MDVYEARGELLRMRRADLFKLTSSQKISRCQISGDPCCFYLCYRGFSFCVSEILGQSCQVERAEKADKSGRDLHEIDYSLPLMEKWRKAALRKEKAKVEFRVYYRDVASPTIVILGKITERRTKERGNNLRNLFAKAIKDYSACVANPSTIFLVSS